jgi:hypothetical protein
MLDQIAAPLLAKLMPGKPHHPRVVLLVLDALAGAPPRRSQSYRFDRLLQPPCAI